MNSTAFLRAANRLPEDRLSAPKPHTLVVAGHERVTLTVMFSVCGSFAVSLSRDDAMRIAEELISAAGVSATLREMALAREMAP